MGKLVKLVVFLTLLGVVKAAHKLILLAAIGLATLMMIHVLAQDYNKINKRPVPMKKSYFFKRSINEHTQEIVSFNIFFLIFFLVINFCGNNFLMCYFFSLMLTGKRFWLKIILVVREVLFAS